ncbi:Cytidylate kinase [Hondaea fermentalgiana]|uniref:Cytidylate kinase n=1 Tax=Hondaea fermentalgiana TaxID=2315210 RepID=A0A2R5GLL9_9STRA|nr:Cytidylate kinase [Hondaea fermentalgiana]|eukprot:GBG31209.1 Cytidylate kinase [Hondaea fermentalgiana]
MVVKMTSKSSDTDTRHGGLMLASLGLVALGAAMLAGAHLYKARTMRMQSVSSKNGQDAVVEDKLTEEEKTDSATSPQELETKAKDASLDKKNQQEEEEEEEEESKDEVPDIEDLVGKSLIPATLAEMKKSGVKPYTSQEKEDKIQALEAMPSVPKFAAHLRQNNVKLHRTKTEVMQLNIGFYCNQACSHCHVDSSPLRKQMMNRQVADKCIDIIRKSPSVNVVDLTGGAPELNREFRHLVEVCSQLGKEVIDRCNLTVLLEPHMADLPAFLAKHKVRVIASLPCYLEQNVDKQRGDRIFQRSIKGLKMLNEVGYGKPGTGLFIDLVYNPTGVHLPPSKDKLIGDYKRVLSSEFGIVFNDLHCITNMPINRYYDHLREQGRLEEYMAILVNAFNPVAAEAVMCRKYLSIDPFGQVFDCDFNQQLGLHLRVGDKDQLTVFDIDSTDELRDVPIVTRKHCYACTAGAGSSCRQE